MDWSNTAAPVISTTAVNATDVRFSWPSTGTGTQYATEMRKLTGGRWVRDELDVTWAGTAASPAAYMPSLVPGSTYQLKICKISHDTYFDRVSPWSNVLEFTTPAS